jgi:sugar lactone lactonase YvrE
MSSADHVHGREALLPSPTSEPRVLVDGLAYVESPRWHDGRLWFCHWGAGEIVAVDLDGKSELVGAAPPKVNAEGRDRASS